MESTWIEIGGLTIRAPVTAGTNLALAVQCALYFRSLREGPGARTRLWSGFFLMMALATLVGVVKHGFGHELSETGLFLVLWVSNLTGSISTYFAQRASLVFHAPEHLTRRLDRLFRAQLLVFLAGNLVLGPRLLFLLVNTAVGLSPVIVVEARAFHRGHPGAGWIAGGLSVSIVSAVIYAAGLSVGPWLNHVDIAHLLMGASLWLMVRGCGPYPIALATAPVDRLAREHDDDGRLMERVATGTGGS